MAYRKTPAVKAHLKAQREAIIQAGVDVLASHGKDGFTTTRVVERAGISNASLYNYFADANELWAAVVADCLSRYTNAMVEAFTSPEPRYPLNAFSRALGVLYATLGKPRLARALYETPAYRKGMRTTLEMFLDQLEFPPRARETRAAAILGAMHGLSDIDISASAAVSLCLELLGVPVLGARGIAKTTARPAPAR